ncbi:MAG: ADP-glyceromanno-heptose 6-epimerase precursor [Bacteroidetes bacterium]|jgi:ADP-L-glycero-D-manno-heptose 6-epimerase|nr:ADP-glyceromanno-heptose 6-epimerase precursor [Bacteroidota bacterium]MDF2450965.1 ADP-glyceromanno-heptose 6-epimerase precursor [Bacteroidota bacterium]
MIVITGAAGFIGSCLITKLNNEGHENLILVDDFSKLQKIENYHTKNFIHKMERSIFLKWFEEHAAEVTFVYHIGARTDTTEFSVDLFNELNLNYTKSIWNTCAKHFIPLVYASSAATYGLGEFGYTDDETKIPLLKPLNPYGDSKNDFDKWAITQKTCPPKWAGFKFFNVYGPNEYHKGRMASVIFHSFHQINDKGQVKLFRSHNPGYSDGGQLRDFVYVKDVVEVLYFAYGSNLKSGIYNLGSGKARTFLDLANATFKALGKEPQIEFIDTPIDIRDKYQYFTEANMNKLIGQGYHKPFTSLEEGVHDYVTNYLVGTKYF